MFNLRTRRHSDTMRLAVFKADKIMADKRFDVSVKDLVEDYKTAWPELIDAGPNCGVDVIDADISTVTGAADKALLVHGNTYDWILNLEVQAGHRLNLPDRLHLKSTLFGYRHGLPVRSAVVLLRRAAEATNLTGLREDRLPDHRIRPMTYSATRWCGFGSCRWSDS
jgi:hypothetical protein